MSYMIGRKSAELYPKGNRVGETYELIRSILNAKGINGGFDYHYETVMNQTTFQPMVIIRGIALDNEKDYFIAQLQGEHEIMKDMYWVWSP
jgi:hypothetical protein